MLVPESEPRSPRINTPPKRETTPKKQQGGKLGSPLAPLNLGACSNSEEDDSNEKGWFGDKQFNIVELDDLENSNIENEINRLPCYEHCECNPSCVAPDYIQDFFDMIPEYDYFVVDIERHIIAHPAKSWVPTLHEYVSR